MIYWSRDWEEKSKRIYLWEVKPEGVYKDLVHIVRDEGEEEVMVDQSL